MLNSYNLGYEWTEELMRGVRAGLETHATQVDLSIEFLDTRRRGDQLFPETRALIEARYSPARTAVVIAADDPALQFLLDYAPNLLASVPVVFCGVSNDALAARVPRQRFTGVREVMGVSPILDLALSLHSPRRVFVVSDATLTSQTHGDGLEAYARQRGLELIHMDGRKLTLDQILARLRTETTPQDLLMTTPFVLDHSGKAYTARESVAMVTTASKAPAYSAMGTDIGNGLVASGVNSGFEHGLATARLTSAVLNGRAPQDLPVENFTRVAYQFDHQQLVRYGIDAAKLPRSAVIVGQPRSFYRENTTLIRLTGLFVLGQMVVIVTLAWNVIQRRKAERNLARTESDLRQAQKMDAIGRLAGGIAHDFNNLLTVIMGHSALLREAGDSLTPKQTAMSLDGIQAAGTQAATLTRQLLAFSRRQVLQARIVNLNMVVHEIESMLGRLIGERIALVTTLDPHLLNLSVDPGQIQQVILNLVVNARDAMPNGGRIVIGTRNAVAGLPPDSESHAGAIGPCVVLTVSDTGGGMSPQTQAQIFEPFFTTKPEGKGTGLGLATVYGIVRQSGGWIDVESQVGKGTTFTLFFPATDATPMPSIALAIQTGDGRIPATLLVVEDQNEVRELAVAALRRAGYDVLEASHGDEAMARFANRADSLSLLLTDVVMPGMNGKELAERLRAKNPNLPVVFMSGYTDEILDQQSLVGPDAAFIAKPFTPSTLVRQVDLLLISKHKRRTEATR
jgi:two-component system cell cycle sensor histidine kinase/response regulator CckA